MSKKIIDTFDKILPKRIKTNRTGVFYKEIERTVIDEAGKATTKILTNDKVYLIRYTDENKKERFVTMGKESDGIKLTYCVNKRSEFITIAMNGELPPQIKRRELKEIITLDSLARVYFDDKAGTESDKRQEAKYDEHVKKRFGRKDLTKLGRADFNKFKSDLDKAGKAKRTVNGILSLTKAIINHSVREYDLVIKNPLDGVRPHKVDTIRRERYLSLDEVKILVDTVRASGDDDLYHFVQLALNTGGRFKTIMAITRKDINFDSGHVTLHDLKSDSVYTGFIGNEMYLEELRGRVEPLEVKDKVIGVPVRTLQRRLKKILDELFNEGLDSRDFTTRVVAHTLRHTFASQLVIAGTSLYVVQRLLNHAKSEMTERYAKLSPEVGADAVRGLFNA